MQKEVLDKYLKAGKIAGQAIEKSKELVKPNTAVIEICEGLEKFIRDSGGEIAFPVNISLNDTAAHYTASKNDELKITQRDVVKVDVGVHVDGYVGDTAHTIVFDTKHDKLVQASREALNKAIAMCRPGTKLSDISSRIEETIKGFGFSPVSNLTGHGLEQYNLHAEPQIPNVSFSSSYKLHENQVIAIEPFATDGAGMIKETEPTLIYRLVGKGPVRNPSGRMIMRFAEEFSKVDSYGSLQSLPFAERWIPIDSLVKIKIALRELRERGILYDYPVLKEVRGGLISQAEHTVIVKDEPIITTKTAKGI